MHIQKTIERLGYSKNEAKTYLTSLHFGSSTVSELALKTEIPRTSLKIILEKLNNDGLISYMIRKGSKYWTAENPEKFLFRIHENEEAIKAILPRLEMLRHKKGITNPMVKVFIGPSELRLIHDDIIESKQHLYGIITWDKWLKAEGSRADDFTEERIKNFLRSSLLVPKTPESVTLKQRIGKDFQDLRFLPTSFQIENTTLIYGSKVAFISLSGKTPTAVLIDAKDVHNMMFAFFKNLWELST